jgi:hypothetical protein
MLWLIILLVARWEVEPMYSRLDNFAADYNIAAHKNENPVSAHGLYDVPYVGSYNESRQDEFPVYGPVSIAPNYDIAEPAYSETRKYESLVVNMPEEYELSYDVADGEPAYALMKDDGYLTYLD